MTLHRFALVLFFACLPAITLASGTYGRAPIRQVDPVYEQGKAIFTGQLRGTARLSFCINGPEGGESRRVNKKALKPFRGASVGELAAKLHDCEAPESRAGELLGTSDLLAVVHYLDTRYRLRLRR